LNHVPLASIARMRILAAAAFGVCSVIPAVSTFAQTAAAQAAAAQPELPPATKLEAFRPGAGSILVLGYDDLGHDSGISVDVREMRDAKNSSARGLVVEVTESQYRQQSSFVDADEIPELLKGFDAVLDVKTNPTQFKNFEVRYKTQGGLQLTVSNDSRRATIFGVSAAANGKILYSVQAGRALTAERVGLSATVMQNLKGIFEAAQQKLNSLTAPK
jgi:hypothetical protein